MIQFRKNEKERENVNEGASEVLLCLYFIPYMHCTRTVLKSYRNWLSKERGIVDNSSFSLVSFESLYWLG